MTALVALLALSAAPVPQGASQPGILVDFAPLSQVDATDSRAKFRFTGIAESGQRFDNLCKCPDTLSESEKIRDSYIYSMGDYFKVIPVGKTSMFILGIKDQGGKVSPLKELTVKVSYFGADLPEKWTPKVTRSLR